MSEPTVEHGTVRGYQRRCRCEKCRAANAEAGRAGRARRRRQRPPTHGLSTYRNWGCRCEVCSQAAVEDNAAYVVLHPGDHRSGTATLRSRDQSKALGHAYQQETIEAENRGKYWTRTEIELLMRTDLRERELASILGRTYYAIHCARKKFLTRLPQRLIGVDIPKHDGKH